MYLVQHWFNLAEQECEDAVMDRQALRRFIGIDLGQERVPDATTLLKFRRLEDNKLAKPCLPKWARFCRPADEAWHRHHRGCHHHQRAEFDQKQAGHARPRDAPDPLRASSGTTE